MGKHSKIASEPIFDNRLEDSFSENIDGSSFVLSSDSGIIYNIHCYVVSNIIDNCKHLVNTNLDDRYKQFKYDYDQTKDIMIYGNISFIWNNNIYNCQFNPSSLSIEFESNVDISSFKEHVFKEIKNKNPYKNKLLYYINSEEIQIKSPINVDFDNVILQDQIKNDIYDNTIYSLDALKTGNGIILHGIPGSGKSLICSAIANNAVKKGYSVIYLTNLVSFEYLQTFVDYCVGDCIIIFEDIDSFAISREKNDYAPIAEFLQFLNGIAESKTNIVFIATTNYLEKLDDAIANRPVRFNRKYKFDYPNPAEIDEMIKLYFDNNICQKYSKYCHGINFTGAHIKEIKRSADLLISKSEKKLTYDDVFMESLNIVKENFSITLNASFGFNN